MRAPPQTQERDTVLQDTLPPDSISTRNCNHCIVLVVPIFAAYAAVLLVAPPLLLLWEPAVGGAAMAFAPTDTIRPGIWKDHVDVYVTGGAASTEAGGSRWGHSESLEFLRKGVYAEVRREHFYFPRYVQYETVRVGYLVHPNRAVWTGITLGYREAHGVRGQSGPELGLPFVVGGRKGWGRFEPSYVVSRTGANWNFRGQGIYPIPGGRYFAGVSLEAKSLPLPLRDRGLFASTGAAIFGVRY